MIRPVEDSVRIEDRLDPLERGKKAGILTTKPRASKQARAMFAVERSAARLHSFKHRLGYVDHLQAIVLSMKIEKWASMEDADPRVRGVGSR